MNKIEINFKLQFETIYHIGTGLSGSDVDRKVKKYITYTNSKRTFKPYIPGSTFKGTFKHKFYQIITNKLFFINKSITEKIMEEIFGSPQKEGTLYFDSLYPEEGASESEQVIRPRIMINRSTGVVNKGSLFFTEYWWNIKKLKFRGEIKGYINFINLTNWNSLINSVPYEIFLLYITLKLFNYIGADKTIGAGWCSISNIEIKLNNKNIISEIEKKLEDLFPAIELLKGQVK